MDICNSRWTLEEWLFRSFKSLKNGIKIAVEKKNLLFSELQTVSFEAGTWLMKDQLDDIQPPLKMVHI